MPAGAGWRDSSLLSSDTGSRGTMEHCPVGLEHTFVDVTSPLKSVTSRAPFHVLPRSRAKQSKGVETGAPSPQGAQTHLGGAACVRPDGQLQQAGRAAGMPQNPGATVGWTGRNTDRKERYCRMCEGVVQIPSSRHGCCHHQTTHVSTQQKQRRKGAHNICSNQHTANSTSDTRPAHSDTQQTL